MTDKTRGGCGRKVREGTIKGRLTEQCAARDNGEKIKMGAKEGRGVTEMET